MFSGMEPPPLFHVKYHMQTHLRAVSDSGFIPGAKTYICEHRGYLSLM